MNELNEIDNSITYRQPNELLRIIFYDDCQKTDFDCNYPIHQK